MDFSIYKDIKNRTNGEIYIGVVGPVRTGKSTFIKNFMNLAIIPNIKDENDIKRAQDELPQSAAGKTIMTTEPKFIPNKAVNINLKNDINASVRLIDCVGYMVDGATGYLEEDKERMVKTPWLTQEIPFSKAAELGTQKVISEHSTIGIVITTDGSFTDIQAENYMKATDMAIKELEKINKHFVIVVNSMEPESEKCKSVVKKLESNYRSAVIPLNCLQLSEKDINEILSKILFEFPIAKINFMCPKWVNVLEDDNEIKNAVLELSRNILMVLNKIKDINSLPNTKENPYIKSITINNVNLSDGEVTITYAIYDKYYYMTLSEMTNTQINNELELVSFVKELAEKKDKFEKVNYAIDEVKTKGYGIVVPTKDEITLENPQLIRSGGKFGVKIKANAPSMHFVKANIVTEISPIIGSEEQANDLIDYINGQKTDENANIWDTNIFGKTIEQIVKDGIVAKISGMSDETQGRMQNTIEKITNDQSKGVICILL